MIWMYHKSYTLTDLRIPSPNSSLESDSREGVLVELMSVFAGMLHVDPMVPSIVRQEEEAICLFRTSGSDLESLLCIAR